MSKVKYLYDRNQLYSFLYLIILPWKGFNPANYLVMTKVFRLTFTVILSLIFCNLQKTYGQDSPNQEPSYKPIVLKLDEEGQKYIRFIMWHQIWLTTSDISQKGGKFQLNPSIRRSRFLAYAQISQDFLILTHVGLNGLNTNNLTALGNDGDGPQLFLHGAWAEFRLNRYLYIGGGLHYWKGLTRLASQSTLNFMTLDQSRPFVSWHSLGITDQFARHLGFYAKGQIGKLDYRVAINTPMRKPMGGGKDYGLRDSGLSYTGVSNPDLDGNPVGNMIAEGYIRYNFFDTESNKLPYNVGTYLGRKRVLAIGAGFFVHPNGIYEGTSGTHSAVRHFAIDGFLDYPVPEGAIHAYASLISFDYGPNYVSRWAGTGTAAYGQAGYYLRGLKIMPYIAYHHGMIDGYYEPISSLDIGINYFVRGHNAKITLEYHQINGDIRETAISTQNDFLSQMRLQMHIFL